MPTVGTTGKPLGERVAFGYQRPGFGEPSVAFGFGVVARFQGVHAEAQAAEMNAHRSEHFGVSRAQARKMTSRAPIGVRSCLRSDGNRQRLWLDAGIEQSVVLRNPLQMSRKLSDTEAPLGTLLGEETIVCAIALAKATTGIEPV